MMAFAWPALTVAATPLRVIYPRPESHQDPRQHYPLQVLRLALEHSGRNYHLQPSRFTMQQARSLRMLAAGRALDIVWTVPTKQRADMLRMIAFPIDRGLIGWRVLLIHRGDESRFAAISTLPQLARQRAGQGHDWPDLSVLRANGLQTSPSATYDGLFHMLALRRIDYLPRSVAEVGDELQRFPAQPIALDKHLLLHYPSALCFFVNPRNRSLASAIALGLRRSMADGSLLRLFHRTYDAQLRALDLPHRRIIELTNPILPAGLPLQQQALWYTPGTR